jgi:hypothetical protein
LGNEEVTTADVGSPGDDEPFVGTSLPTILRRERRYTILPEVKAREGWSTASPISIVDR